MSSMAFLSSQVHVMNRQLTETPKNKKQKQNHNKNNNNNNKKSHVAKYVSLDRSLLYSNNTVAY